MTIFNLGSINIDKVYRVERLPLAGETLACYEFQVGLGGKGANMSVAAARGGASVVHIGAVGREGKWTVDRLLEYGVSTHKIAFSDEETGHAVIALSDDGENQILLWPGANTKLTQSQLSAGLETISLGDTFVTQNETNAQSFGAEIAKSKGARVIYAAAPFGVEAVKSMIGFCDVLVLNEVEAEQLEDGLNLRLAELGVADIVVTLGAQGCRHFAGDTVTHYPAFPIDVIDTTGAGDTFTGFLAAGLDRGQPISQAIRLGQKAGALMVNRLGTADVIPDLKEIEDSGL